MKADQPTAQPDARETVAYAEILKIAHEEGLRSIATELLAPPSDDNGRLAIVKAVVEVEKGRFEALGDADPISVEERFIPHLIRVAETRAKARALRDAVNCGVAERQQTRDRQVAPGDRETGRGQPLFVKVPLLPDVAMRGMRVHQDREAARCGPVQRRL